MITGEIKRFLRDDGAVKISRTLKENAMKGWRCEELLRRKLNRQPTINEISKESGIDAESLIEAFEAATPPGSIYESVYDNGDKEIRLLDTITGEEIEDGVINKVMIDDILSRLTEREKEIILLRYFRGKTQSEIAKIIGVSQVQISRIEQKSNRTYKRRNAIAKTHSVKSALFYNFSVCLPVLLQSMSLLKQV